MVTNYLGTRPMGSESLETSVANVQIIPEGKVALNFACYNNGDCLLEINGKLLFILDKQGVFFPVVSSFKFITPNITYNWIGSER